jgi:hypothetical protein
MITLIDGRSVLVWVEALIGMSASYLRFRSRNTPKARTHQREEIIIQGIRMQFYGYALVQSGTSSSNPTENTMIGF